MTIPSLNTSPNGPLPPGRRKPSFSLAAIGIALLLWGIGFKLASSFVVETLGVDLEEAAKVTTTETGRYVHHRRR